MLRHKDMFALHMFLLLLLSLRFFTCIFNEEADTVLVATDLQT